MLWSSFDKANQAKYLEAQIIMDHRGVERIVRGGGVVKPALRRRGAEKKFAPFLFVLAV